MTKKTRAVLSRRALLAAGASVPLVSIMSRRAGAADFT